MKPRNRQSSSRKSGAPADARRNRHSDNETIVPKIAEEDFYRTLESAQNPLVLILDEVTDPHNLGACLRSANAAGALGIITPKHHSASVSETVARISCGAAENTPVITVTNLARSLKNLQELGFWLVGTDDTATQSLYEVNLKGSIGLVLGAEGSGMRRLTRESCDFLVQIPMQGTVPCLNVSVAAGICLFEAVRQRSSS